MPKQVSTDRESDPAHHGVIHSFNSKPGHGCGTGIVNGKEVKVHLRNILMPPTGENVTVVKGQVFRCDLATTKFGEEAINIHLQ